MDRHGRWAVWMSLATLAVSFAAAQSPIAMIPLKTPAKGHEDEAPRISGALEVVAGRAMIATSGSIASGSKTTEVLLPRRGVLRVCAATTVKLAADHTVPVDAGQTPGLMMALDHGAIEASFATGRNADVVMTPDFRIVISGPGAADVKIRLGGKGDTCVENAGTQAPYVLVSSVFDDGAYQVRSGQRVTFQHGSLREVVDTEKESCGCPPDQTRGNEFPVAQSEGLAPLAAPATAQPGSPASRGEISVSLSHQGVDPNAPKTADTATGSVPDSNSVSVTGPSLQPKQNPGFLKRIKNFFRRVFGAEEQGR